MICPHCEADTPPTVPYCQSCGRSVDLTFEKVQEAFDTEAEDRAVRDTELWCRALLAAGVTAFALVLLARGLLVPEVQRPPILPAAAHGALEASPERLVVPALPLPSPPWTVPQTSR